MKLYKFLIVLFVSGMFASCGDDLAELNVNPNTSPSANPAQVLTAGQGYYGIGLDAYSNENSALFAQYVAGGPGVALLDLERYFVEPVDFNTEWSFSYYQSLSDLDFVIDNGNEARAGIANVMSVAILQTLVDQFGNIPYSEALRGSLDDGSILAPKYDDAKSIYDDLLVRIDASIASLSATSDEAGAEDLIYSGDLSQWVKFANSVKLRLLMRQSITGDASVLGPLVKALVAEGNLIDGPSDVAAIPFTGEVGQNWNPQYARREQGIGQFYVASNSSVKIMEELNDPRLNVLFDVAENTGTIVGMDQGNVANLIAPSKDDFSFPSAVIYGSDISVILMSDWEVKFLRAEAAMRFGTTDSEKDMFESAIAAHFDFLGIGSMATDYIAGNVNYDTGASTDVKSNTIGVQKWISMNGIQETEGWIESRRFDIAGSNVFTNTTSGIFKTPTRSVFADGVFPSIKLYPQTELSLNSNAPQGRSLTEKVFWDN